jgi:hypothetical protein
VIGAFAVLERIVPSFSAVPARFTRSYFGWPIQEYCQATETLW